MLRLFVGIEFPPELKLRLSLLQTALPGARWIDPGNLHLTLRFIGEIPEDLAADVDEAMGRLRARRFTLRLAGTGIFGGNRPHPLWVGVESDPEVDKLGYFLAAHALFRADPLPVDRFSLIASFPTKAGSIYEDQADYMLT